jgi:5'-nucleotidase, C-terminal domain
VAEPDPAVEAAGGALDKRLTYKIDVAQDAGSRILHLQYDGVDVGAAQEFVLAVNNYRQSGGGGFPAVSTAPVVYNRQVEIRQLLIDWGHRQPHHRPGAVRQCRLEPGLERPTHHDQLTCELVALGSSRTERDPRVARQIRA